MQTGSVMRSRSAAHSLFGPKPRKFVMCERGDLCKLTATVRVHSIIARRFASTPLSFRASQLTRVKYSRFALCFFAHSHYYAGLWAQQQQRSSVNSLIIQRDSISRQRLQLLF